MGKSSKKNSKKHKKKTQVTKKKVTKKNTGKKNTSKKQNSTVKKNTANVQNNKAKKSTSETKKIVVKQENSSANTKKKKTVVEEKSKNEKKLFQFKGISRKTRKRLILISILCLILAILLMFPFGVTNYKSEASGKILDVPKFSKLSEECCMYSATFKSVRSYSSLKLELENIMSQYEKLDCDGKNYFYNKEEDFTVTEYGVKRGVIFNEFYITYGNGNSCEIDTTLKNIELLPDDYSLADAKKDGNYVIDGDKIFNSTSYDQFLTDVEQKIPSTLRIASLTKDGDLILTDLKYLSDGKFKVVYDGTRDRNNKEDDRVIMAYVYEHIGIYKNKLYAYNGDKIKKDMLKTDDVYYLFEVKE